MKLWQLLDIFRDEKPILHNEFEKPEWQVYKEINSQIESITDRQDRELLDMEVDYTLLKNICIQSSKKVYYVEAPKERPRIFLYQRSDTLRVISIEKAIDLFNHDEIDEVFEKSEADVRQLSNKDFL